MAGSCNDSGSAKTYAKVTHCIFDLDGLLLDTEGTYEQVVRELIESFGKKLTNELRFKLLGANERRGAETVINELQLDVDLEIYLTRYREMCVKVLGKSPLMPGAKRLLCHLQKHNIPFALATSSAEDMYQMKTAIYSDLFSLFHHHVCGSTDPEVKEGKPAPDIFLVAAARFPDKPAPAKCLVFEDAPNGVQAGSSAGMQVVMVPDDRVPAAQRALATQVLKSLVDFKPEDFGLPAFDACSK